MESKLSKAQQEAKSYVDQHQLEKLIGEMLNALVHAKDPAPVIFMIKYLAGLCSAEELSQNGITVQGQLPQAKPLIKFPTFPDTCNSYLKRFLTRDLWDRLNDKRTKLHGDFLTCIRAGIENPETTIGVYATDDEAYGLFEGLFVPIAEEMHNWSKANRHRSRLEIEGFSQENLDPKGKYIEAVRIRVSRNFEGFPFPVNLNPQERERVEKKALEVLNVNLGGSYIPRAEEDQFAALELVFDSFNNTDPLLKSTKAFEDWPKNRGIFQSEGVYVNVNQEDHLKIYSFEKSADIQKVWKQVVSAASKLENHTAFSSHDSLGYLTASPANLGTSMKITFRVHLPELCRTPEFTQLLSTFNASYLKVAEGVVDVFNIKKLGVNEVELANQMSRLVQELLKKEKTLQGEPEQDEAQTQMPELPPDTYIQQHLSEEIWNQLSSVSTSYGNSLTDCFDFESETGLVARDEECYSAFKPLFEKTLASLNGASSFIRGNKPAFEFAQHTAVYLKNWNVQILRSLKGKTLVSMDEEELNEVQQKVSGTLKNFGDFIDLANLTKEDMHKFSEKFKLKIQPGGKDYSSHQLSWPKGRGMYVNYSTKTLIGVNTKEHIEVNVTGEPDELQNAWDKAYSVCEELEKNLQIAFDEEFGYLNSVVKNTGNGLSLHARLHLPKVVKQDLQEFLEEHSLDCSVEKDQLEVNSKINLGKSPEEVAKNFSSSVLSLIEWEQSLECQEVPSLENSKIAEVLQPDNWNKFCGQKTQENFTLCNHLTSSQLGFVGLSESSFRTYSELLEGFVPNPSYQKDLSLPELVEPDSECKFIKSFSLFGFRNLAEYTFTPYLTSKQASEIQQKLVEVFESECISLSEVQDYETKLQEGTVPPKPDQPWNNNWPNLIGVLTKEDLSVWVNFKEHLTIKVSGSSLVSASEVLLHNLSLVESKLQVAFDEKFGNLSSDLFCLGTGLLLKASASLPKVSGHEEFTKFLEANNLKHETKEETVEFSYTKGASEAQSIAEFCETLQKLVSWEEELSS